jgi:hypothetical protein
LTAKFVPAGFPRAESGDLVHLGEISTSLLNTSQLESRCVLFFQ